MAERYEFQHEARPELLQELVAAGFPPDTPVEFDGQYDDVLGWHGGTRTWVTTGPERFDAAASVVAAHNPAAYDAARDAAKHSYSDAIAFLKTYYQTPNASITVDQSKNAIKALTVLARTQHQGLAGG